MKKVTKPAGRVRDSKFLSSQKHEMVYISKTFTGDNGENIPVQLVYFIYFMMQANYKKVTRINFYGVLSLMGYSKGE